MKMGTPGPYFHNILGEGSAVIRFGVQDFEITQISNTDFLTVALLYTDFLISAMISSDG